MIDEMAARKSRKASKHRQSAAFPFRTVADTISILIEIRIDDQRLHFVLRDLTRLSGPISVECGCDHCRIWIDYEEPRSILLTIGWRSEVELARFIRSEKFASLLSILETSSSQPQLYVSDRRSIPLPQLVKGSTVQETMSQRRTVS